MNAFCVLFADNFINNSSQEEEILNSFSKKIIERKLSAQKGNGNVYRDRSK